MHHINGKACEVKKALERDQRDQQSVRGGPAAGRGGESHLLTYI